ncbi:unnamed protein product [Moneuplotes crassus]|uniref:Uncharacterized protein n=1 Tax=Euplotes crassus TaxID=5936 RepID=A0AAD1UMA2_EUPCR|nr:unnamed protein product [Moneuplotes crassus]
MEPNLPRPGQDVADYQMQDLHTCSEGNIEHLETTVRDAQKILNNNSAAKYKRSSKMINQMHQALIKVKEETSSTDWNFLKTTHPSISDRIDLLRTTTNDLLGEYKCLIAANSEHKGKFPELQDNMPCLSTVRPTACSNPDLVNLQSRDGPKHLQALTFDIISTSKKADIENIIHKKEDTLSKHLWSSTTKSIKGLRRTFPPDEDFCIWIKRRKERNLIKKMKSIALPKCSEIYIYDCLPNSKYAKVFLEDTLQYNCKVLLFESNVMTSINRFLPQICKASHLITEKIVLWRFSINASHLRKILATNKLKSTVEFERCKITLPTVPDLSACCRGAMIEALCFVGCGEETHSDWVNNLQDFENLIHGLWNSDLRESLKEINLTCCKLSQSHIDRIFKQYCFSHAEIIGNFHKSC